MTTYNDSLNALGITSTVNLVEENPQRFYVTIPHTFGLQLEGGATKELGYPTDIQSQSNSEEHRISRGGSTGSIRLSNQPINQNELDYLVALYHVSMGGLQGFLIDEQHYNLSDRSSSCFFDGDLEYEVLVSEGKCSDSYQITTCDLARSNNTAPATLASPTTVTVNNNAIPIEYKEGILLLTAQSGTLSLQYAYLAKKLPVVEALGSLPCNTGTIRFVGYWGKDVIFVVSSASSSTVYRLNKIKKNASTLEVLKTFNVIPSAVISGIEYEDSYYFIGLKPSVVKLFKNGNTQDIQSTNTITQLCVFDKQLWFAGRSATNTVVVGTLKPHLEILRDFGGVATNTVKFLLSDPRNLYLGYNLSSSDPLQISQFSGSWSNIVLNPIYPYDSESWKTVPLFGGFLLYSTTKVKGWLCGNLFYPSPDIQGAYTYLSPFSGSLFSVSGSSGGFLDIAPVGGDRAAIVPHLMSVFNRSPSISRFISYGNVEKGAGQYVYKISYLQTNLIYPDQVPPSRIEVFIDPRLCDWFRSPITNIQLYVSRSQDTSTVCEIGQVIYPTEVHVITFANGNTQSFQTISRGNDQYRCYPAGVMTHSLTDFQAYTMSDFTSYTQINPSNIVGGNCIGTNYALRFYQWNHDQDRSEGFYTTIQSPFQLPPVYANKAIVSVKFFDSYSYIRPGTSQVRWTKQNNHVITYHDGSQAAFATNSPSVRSPFNTDYLTIAPEGFPSHYIDEVSIYPANGSPDVCPADKQIQTLDITSTVTDCDRVLKVGETLYTPYPFTVSSIRTGLGLQVETCEIKTNRRDSTEDSLFSAQFVEADLYRSYLVSLGKVQISSFVNSKYPIRQDISGWAIGEIKAEDGEQTIELRGANQRLQNKINVKTSPFCPYAFGSPRCGYPVGNTEQSVTVIAVEGDSIRVSYSGNASDLNNGLAVWQTGSNINIRSDIREAVVDGSNARIYFWHNPPFEIAVGDKLKTYWGCDKTITQCAARGNNLNFGGFPWVPGTHYYLAGSNGAVEAT